MILDYIIVGAGSAGSVLADRLSENGRNQVLLIEAGGRDNSLFIHMPKGVGRLLGHPKYNLVYATEPEEGNGGVSEVWHRGLTLGGSSSINGMVYNRGQPEDYDHLEALGCVGWNWANMLPHFRAVEDHPFGAHEWRGAAGPLHLSQRSIASPVGEATIAAGEKLGLSHLKDMNEAHGQGTIGLPTYTIGNGRRMSAATAFLKRAAKRSNLQIVMHKGVDRLVLRAGQVTGVICRDGTEYSAGKEVIVAAGALESPGILMRSGIGPADTLRALGIPVVHDAPEVGRNLIEHRVVGFQLRVKSYAYSENNSYDGWRLLAHTSRYLLARSGVMAQGSFDVIAFLRSLPSSARPDAQLLLGAFAFDATKQPLGMQDNPSISVFGFILHPNSCGSLELRSADPADKPIIRPNYLTTAHDQSIAIGLTRFIRKLSSTSPLSEIVTGETVPGASIQTDDEILDFWRKGGSTGHHTIGTCAMGSHSSSVLDNSLRVRGITGARVMDASVLPYMVSGNTNAPVMAMAHRAAELILADARVNSLTN